MLFLSNAASLPDSSEADTRFHIKKAPSHANEKFELLGLEDSKYS